MTYLKDVFGRDLFANFDKVFVGFDDHYSRLAQIHDDLAKNIPNYPPYNIRKTGDNTYLVELAVAGFARQDIEITLDGDKMIISGKAASENEDNANTFLFKGISNRAFTRTFTLDDQVVVKGADMLNGMLQVVLERIIPEHRKPKKIEINDAKPSKGSKQFLTETEL
jgi:molecular chaperone IbpA